MFDLHPGFSRSTNINKAAFEFSTILRLPRLIDTLSYWGLCGGTE